MRQEISMALEIYWITYFLWSLRDPSINDVGKFSAFLRPPSPMSEVFWYFPSAIWTNFDPSPFSIANIVYGRPLKASLDDFNWFTLALIVKEIFLYIFTKIIKK